jgi:hypothetical protein
LKSFRSIRHRNRHLKHAVYKSIRIPLGSVK